MKQDLQGRSLLVAIGGGIAAYKTVDVVRRLMKRGASVRVMMTRAATRFVNPTTFSSITGHPVGLEMFSESGSVSVDHLELPHRADLVLVAPATADLIAKMAHGIADDLVTTALLAAKCPVFISPAMNTSMYEHPATQANLNTLLARGVRAIGPETGEMAAPGELPGLGRMSEPEQIEEAIASFLTQGRRFIGKRVLITAGRTEEPVDDVRVLTNRSSGRMGVELAREFHREGAEVVLIHGAMDMPPPPEVKAIRIGTAIELLHAVQGEIKGTDIVLYVAAVADWRPAVAKEGKLKRESTDGSPSIELAENPDIAKETSPLSSGFKAGFALEPEIRDEIALAKLKRKGLDAIFLNHVSAIGGQENKVIFLAKDGARSESPLLDKSELARWIADEIAASLPL